MNTVPPDNPDRYEEMLKDQRNRMDYVPHAAAIGLTLGKIWHANAIVHVAHSAQLIGNPDTEVIHGGVITTVLDHVSGTAVHSALPDGDRQIATLDLRIDYLRPATANKDITAHAECYKVTRTIAFVRGTAYNDDPDNPIATSQATFMLK